MLGSPRVLMLLLLWDFLERRILTFLSNTVPGKAGGCLCPFSSAWRGTVSGSVRALQAGAPGILRLDSVFPPEALLRSQPAHRIPHCPPIIAPAACCLPSRVSRDGKWDWRQALSDAHPSKLHRVYVTVCVPLGLHPPSPNPFVKVELLCGFILGQKYSSWFALCAHERTRGRPRVVQGPCPLCLSVVTGIRVEGVSGRGQVNILWSIIVIGVF